MLELRSLNNTCGRKVYTETGKFFGEIEEAFVQDNKVFSWKIKSTPNSLISKMMSGAKGVIVPQPLIKSVGDIVIVSKSAMSTFKDDKPSSSEGME